MSMKSRYILAFVEGLFLHALIFRPFLPYSVRERNVPNFWAILVMLLIAGFAATARISDRTFKLCAFVVLGMCAGNAFIIAIDWMKDPTSHNLFPFEFIMIASAIIPVYVGGLISSRLTGASASS